jgi:hypothetical protein
MRKSTGVDKMERFSQAVRDGTRLGYTNRPISDIATGTVARHGAEMVCEARKPYTRPDLRAILSPM